MKIKDLTTEIYDSLLVNKIRSGLTVLGIVIGIASVISMISIGQGAQESVQTSIESMGSNLLTVSPGRARGVGTQVSGGQGSANSLTMADAEAIALVDGILAIAPEQSSRLQIVASGANTNVSVDGITPAYSTVKNLTVAEGTFITDQHVDKRSKVAVIGPTVRDELFGENATGVVGQKIRISNMSFTVVGVTETKGGSSFGSTDSMVFIPITTAQQFLTGTASGVSTLNVQAKSAEVMDQVQADITSLLLSRHGISDSTLADFNVRNQADMLETASSITETFTILLGAVAAISLVVGGIGIMNMMLTTVTERTREIGLRKAIGAKKGDIRIQFLAEAMVLTLLGGILGVVLGMLLAYVVSTFFSITTNVTWKPIALAFGVSATIGIVFGYYPAYKASKLRPIEALRYE